jgi:hypothetical protein
MGCLVLDEWQKCQRKGLACPPYSKSINHGMVFLAYISEPGVTESIRPMGDFINQVMMCPTAGIFS